MANSNLFALNELLEKIKAGEGTAKTNLEALNALCILSGGQGGHKTNLDALNEILSVFSPALPSQEKNLAVTENGNYEVLPDENFVLSKVGVSVNVPSSGGGEIFLRPEGFAGANLYKSIERIDLTNFNFGTVTDFNGFLSSFTNLKEVIFPQGKIALGNVDLYAMFNQCGSLEKIDLSAFSFSSISGLNNFANNCFALRTATFGTYSAPVKGNANYLFYNCREMITCDISALKTINIKGLSDAFFNCVKLENLAVGENFLASTAINSFNLSTSKALSHDSLVHVFTQLATRENGPVISIGSTNLAKLTEEEIAIATNKGWSVT